MIFQRDQASTSPGWSLPSTWHNQSRLNPYFNLTMIAITNGWTQDWFSWLQSSLDSNMARSLLSFPLYSGMLTFLFPAQWGEGICLTFSKFLSWKDLLVSKTPTRRHVVHCCFSTMLSYNKTKGLFSKCLFRIILKYIPVGKVYSFISLFVYRLPDSQWLWPVHR